MKIRVEVRRPVLTEHPASKRVRPEVHDRLRGVLVLPAGGRVTLPPKELPLLNDDAIGRFVRDSALKIRDHVADDATVEMLSAQLWALAEPYRISAEALVEKEARERAVLQRTRNALGRNRTRGL